VATDFEDFGAHFRSLEQCEQIADRLRLLIGCNPGEPIGPIMAALDRLGFEIIFSQYAQMGDARAFARPHVRELVFREDLVQELLDDTPAARFDALHEAVHGSIHTGQSRFFRMAEGNELFPFLRKEESVEEQADRIARAALMPREMLDRLRQSRELSDYARAPLREAATRIKEVASISARSAPKDVSRSIHRLAVAARPSAINKNVAEAEKKKRRLWNGLPIIPQEDPSEYRQCGRYRIAWSEFGKTTECGWFVDQGRIISFFARRYD
jgi:hypothetical protein